MVKYKIPVNEAVLDYNESPKGCWNRSYMPTKKEIFDLDIDEKALK